jgi:hypothetical protein
VVVVVVVAAADGVDAAVVAQRQIFECRNARSSGPSLGPKQHKGELTNGHPPRDKGRGVTILDKNTR